MLIPIQERKGDIFSDRGGIGLCFFTLNCVLKLMLTFYGYHIYTSNGGKLNFSGLLSCIAN